MSNTNETVASLLPATVKELVEATGKSDSTVRKALKELGAVKNDDGKFEVPEVKPRANHGYARNTKDAPKADSRDQAVIEFLESEGSARLADVAEALSITVRAARHAIWRLGKRGQVRQPERGTYELDPEFEEAKDAA